VSERKREGERREIRRGMGEREGERGKARDEERDTFNKAKPSFGRYRAAGLLE
jgi:hypothetical protein